MSTMQHNYGGKFNHDYYLCGHQSMGGYEGALFWGFGISDGGERQWVNLVGDILIAIIYIILTKFTMSL